MKPGKEKKDEAIDRFHKEVYKFLKATGWKPIVGGPIDIEQDFCDRKCCYRLIYWFVSAKKECIR